MNAALMDVNLHYYWIRRGVTRELARAVRDRPTTLEVRDRTVVVFVDYPAFNVPLEDIWLFPLLCEALIKLLKAPSAARAVGRAHVHTWASSAVTGEGRLLLKDYGGDAPVPGLSEALLACF